MSLRIHFAFTNKEKGKGANGIWGRDPTLPLAAGARTHDTKSLPGWPHHPTSD
jgi:hypothetical protein